MVASDKFYSLQQTSSDAECRSECSFDVSCVAWTRVHSTGECLLSDRLASATKESFGRNYGLQCTSEPCQWHVHTNRSASGRLSSVSFANLTAAQASCLLLGSSECRAVTCESGGHPCVLWASAVLTVSSSGHSAYVPEASCFPKGTLRGALQPAPPLQPVPQGPAPPSRIFLPGKCDFAALDSGSNPTSYCNGLWSTHGPWRQGQGPTPTPDTGPHAGPSGDPAEVYLYYEASDHPIWYDPIWSSNDPLTSALGDYWGVSFHYNIHGADAWGMRFYTQQRDGDWRWVVDLRNTFRPWMQKTLYFPRAQRVQFRPQQTSRV